MKSDVEFVDLSDRVFYDVEYIMNIISVLPVEDVFKIYEYTRTICVNDSKQLIKDEISEE